MDRTALGEQALDVVKEVRLEKLMTLDKIYNIKGLEDKDIEQETRIQIATVQSMVKRILYNDEASMPAVTDFDLVIIDEAHRGYILDKEMGEEEIFYRDQRGYQSKYRQVITYFEAVKIALTATPALQTTKKAIRLRYTTPLPASLPIPNFWKTNWILIWKHLTVKSLPSLLTGRFWPRLPAG